MDNLANLSIKRINEIISKLIPSLSVKGSISEYMVNAGEIYLNFLTGNRQYLSLSLPYFDVSFRNDLLKYLKYIAILYKLSQKVPKIPEIGMEIFDYFSYRTSDQYKRGKDTFALSLKKVNVNRLEFEGGVSISTDRFVPIFTNGAIYNNESDIFSAFPLFSTIAREGVFPYPLHIDMDKDGILLLHNNMSFIDSSFLVEIVNSSSFDENEKRNRLLESVIEREIDTSITIRYPYHSNIDSIVWSVMSRRSRMLDIKLNPRLFYKDISDGDVIMLPQLIMNNLDKLEQTLLNLYDIQNTDHSIVLYQAMEEFRSTWQAAELNVYQYPFPSRWLMLIHQDEPLSYYISLLEKDFPVVKGTLLIKFQEVISMIYELNWLGTYLKMDRSAVVLLPDLKAYPKLAQSIVTYLKSRFKGVEDIQNYQFDKNDKIILLDPFNKVFICNNLYSMGNLGMSIKVPDFLFFCYQPFISYYVSKYIYDSLTKGARKELDANYFNYIDRWSILSNSLINQTKNRIKQYVGRYNSVEKAMDVDLIDEELQADGLSKPEIKEFFSDASISIDKKKVEITTADGKIELVAENGMVLVDIQGKIVQLMANELKIGHLFTSVDQLVKRIDQDGVVQKLTVVSKEARRWKKSLLEEKCNNDNLYNHLKGIGLSVTDNTFEGNYLISSEEKETFSLPRSRKDWQVVGDFLGVPDIAVAWINHKGWASVHALRKSYLEVVKLVITYYSTEMGEEMQLIKEVNQLISIANEQYQDATIQHRDAREIIDNISSYFEFHEITNINYS